MDMKADPESYLRENLMADWSENHHQVDVGNDRFISAPDVAIVSEIFKRCQEKVSLITCIHNRTITLPIFADRN